jgi:hypothetical protein
MIQARGEALGASNSHVHAGSIRNAAHERHLVGAHDPKVGEKPGFGTGFGIRFC